MGRYACTDRDAGSLCVLLVFCTVCAPALSSVAAPDNVPAFPGAEGFGKYTQGGRGGDVYCVTTLEDSGPGSLREAIETAEGPRTIVFDVAGTIALKSDLVMRGKRRLTIAGQSAPGKGITLRDYPLKVYESEHIIIRYLRVRLGDENKPDSEAPDVMDVSYNNHLILDHLSLSWGIDGNSDYRGNRNMTLQWLIYSEALNESLHGKGPHAMCTSLRDCAGNTSVHHNIYSTSRNRHPTLGSGVTRFGSNWVVDYRNCVNYNWQGPTNLGGLQVNVIANYYRPGPCTEDLSSPPISMKDADTSRAKGFISGNIFEGMAPEFIQDNFTAIQYARTDNSTSYMSTTREQWELSAEIDCGEFSVPTQTAQQAYETCLKHAGASLARDSVDDRAIKNIIEKSGTIIDSQVEVGGWDLYPMQRRPEDWDRDKDGMSDAWERANALDSQDPADRNGDIDDDGYTNLEEYLNSLCLDPILP